MSINNKKFSEEVGRGKRGQTCDRKKCNCGRGTQKAIYMRPLLNCTP